MLCSSCNRLLISAAHSVPILQRENETGGRKAMIFSSVQSKEDLARCPQAIQKAVLYAMQTDFDALEDGRQEIDGDRMFANLFHLTSQPDVYKRQSTSFNTFAACPLAVWTSAILAVKSPYCSIPCVVRKLYVFAACFRLWIFAHCS